MGQGGHWHIGISDQGQCGKNWGQGPLLESGFFSASERKDL